MFTVRTIRPGDAGSPAGVRVEAAQFDLEPQLPQGRTVCNLFAEFLASQPAEFREQLPFLNKQAIELQWAAAPGGAAFASFFHDGRALGMAVLLSGADEESDSQMLEALRVSILEPMLGPAAAAGLAVMEERPGVQLLALSDRPELTPTLELLVTALASVYFRAVKAMAAAATATAAAH
jgi:hypothetical protein